MGKGGNRDDNEGLKKAFAAGARHIVNQAGFGRQAEIARAAGIKPSYFCDILNGRKSGTESRRISIAKALNMGYRDLINIGFKILDRGGNKLVAETCKEYEPFSEDRAACIYSLAARECGIYGSFFFSMSSLKKLRPPGWIDYVNANRSDSELYYAAIREIQRLKKEVESKDYQDVGSNFDDE